MIRLNVFISVSVENRGAYLEIAKELVAASQKEEGCIAYDIFESSTRPEVLMFCETWASDAALTAHEATAHFTTLVPKLTELGKMKIERFEF